MSRTIEHVKRVFGEPDLVDLSEEALAEITFVWERSRKLSLRERYADLQNKCDELIEVAKQSTQHPVPCCVGCDSCCRGHTIRPFQIEGDIVLDYIEKNFDEAQKVALLKRLESSKPTGQPSVQGRSPCALLVNGGCSVYPA